MVPACWKQININNRTVTLERFIEQLSSLMMAGSMAVGRHPGKVCFLLEGPIHR